MACSLCCCLDSVILSHSLLSPFLSLSVSSSSSHQDPELRHKLRLISEDELPSWLLKDVDEVDQLAFEENEGRLFGFGEEDWSGGRV